MPRPTGQGRTAQDTSGFGRKNQPHTYLTYPLPRGITVTDSQGFSPYSVNRADAAAAGGYVICCILS